MAAGLQLVLLVLAATIDAVVAAADGETTTLATTTPSSAGADAAHSVTEASFSSPTSATAAFLQGRTPEAQAQGAAPRRLQDRDDEDEDLDDDEEYEDSEDGEYVYDEGDPDAYEDPDDFEYENGESDEDEEYGDDVSVGDRDKYDDEYEDQDYAEDDANEDAVGEGATPEGDHVDLKERTATPDDVAQVEDSAEKGKKKSAADAVVRERRAEVRSLSDLPLSKLLRVQTELRRLTGHSPANKGEGQCDSHGKKETSSRRWLTGSTPAASKSPAAAASSPNAQPLNWGAASRKGTTLPSSSTPAPIRRRGGGGGVGDRGGGDRGGGWSSHEDWEEEVHEEEEDEGGWISWDKGHKKKGKGDIGSIFHISVTFLAFLAFGGYLLCLIMQAIKGNGYYGYGTAAATTQGTLRPAPNVMMVMMPTRGATRRPTRPASGRRRRDAKDATTSWRDWVPSFGEDDLRLLPEMDVDRMHRALLVLAEGYASFYHKRYASVPQ